jgi:Bacterial Ig-like domain (group 3)
VLSLSKAWTEAEFNVFGDCCLSQANFTSPTVLVVRTGITDGTTNAAFCAPNDGSTGETNNLTFAPTAAPVCCPYGGAAPGIEFLEAFDTGHTYTASCGPTRIEGDPHLTTADGVHYDFQGAGEFVTLRNPDGLEIQTRQTPIATTFFPPPDAHDGLATCVSINTAVAARVGGHRVTWEPNLSGVPDPSGLQLRIDGAPTTLGPNGLVLGIGGRVAPAAGGALQVDFPDGATLLATPQWWADQSKWYLNVDVSHLGLVSDIGGSSGRGIAGAIAAGSWLPPMPNGTSLGPMPAALPDRYTTLYQTFADAWRVTARDSLFDYAPGTSTDTFTMKDWPKQTAPCVVHDEKPVEPASEAAAIAVCRPVRDSTRRADCVFDVRATGNLGFAKTYVDTQRNQAFSTTTSLTDADNPSQPGQWVTFTAFVAPDATAATSRPSGTVQFAIDGANAGEPTTLDAKGRATLETSRLKIGASRVTASYLPGADSAFLPSTAAEKVHEVNRCGCGVDAQK